MLPGDFIAMKLTGEICTTISGLSEGMMWDFSESRTAKMLLDHYGIDESLIPEIRPTFAEQGRVSAAAAAELGLAEEPWAPDSYMLPFASILPSTTFPV